MNAAKYQVKVQEFLIGIFGVNLVKNEWNSLEFDEHAYNHKLVYGPRIDLAVGPFNSYLRNLDVGEDSTELMKKHFFTKELVKQHLYKVDGLKKIWNSFARCYLAIEIEFSGSSKHILGDIVNVVANGSIGILVINKRNLEKVKRIYKYLLRLEDLGNIKINTLKNLIIFEDKEFFDFLNKVKNKK